MPEGVQGNIHRGKGGKIADEYNHIVSHSNNHIIRTIVIGVYSF